MAYGHSSGLPPWDAPGMIAEKHKLFFSFVCTGEELYPHVQKLEPEPQLASKITGTLLELPENEVIILIEDQLACQDKVHTTFRS